MTYVILFFASVFLFMRELIAVATRLAHLWWAEQVVLVSERWNEVSWPCVGSATMRKEQPVST